MYGFDESINGKLVQGMNNLVKLITSLKLSVLGQVCLFNKNGAKQSRKKEQNDESFQTRETVANWEASQGVFVFRSVINTAVHHFDCVMCELEYDLCSLLLHVYGHLHHLKSLSHGLCLIWKEHLMQPLYTQSIATVNTSSVQPRCLRYKDFCIKYEPIQVVCQYTDVTF